MPYNQFGTLPVLLQLLFSRRILLLITGSAMGARKADPGDSDPGKAGGNDDYLSKRARNNEAVKRSREKARQKAKETHDRVTKLKNENEMLEERIKLLSKELTFLKDIFLAHAGKRYHRTVYISGENKLLLDFLLTCSPSFI